MSLAGQLSGPPLKASHESGFACTHRRLAGQLSGPPLKVDAGLALNVDTLVWPDNCPALH